MILDTLLVVTGAVMCAAAWAYALDAMIDYLFKDDGKANTPGAGYQPKEKSGTVKQPPRKP